MNLFDRLKGAFNPDDTDIDGDESGMFVGDDDFYDREEPTDSRVSSSGYGTPSGALELKVVKPEKYDSVTAQKIADHLRNGRTVVLNLELTNKESARRLIDFLSGVAYTINGYIQRVANNTFVIVPDNVDVSGEQLQEAKKKEESDLFDE